MQLTWREGDAEGSGARIRGHPQHIAVGHDVLADRADGLGTDELHLARVEAFHCAEAPGQDWQATDGACCC